ncbi:unnamed protein product [Euphydryas editha]|uniref:Uncharacterized protein n=1 Tax=Euphydryas editha TaxID=104508 RepID=A0AAU9U404_EUPED|nr:unnamed protein product [Euphydryas editha]
MAKGYATLQLPTTYSSAAPNFLTKMSTREHGKYPNTSGERRKKWNTEKLEDDTTVDLYKKEIEKELKKTIPSDDIDEEWKNIKTSITTAAETIMSLMRSPTKGASATGNSSSYPDLTNISAMDMDTKNMVVRKRKTPENDFTHEFNAFKKELLDILKESNRCQLESINTIGHSISSINEQLKEIKTTTEQLISENGLLKSQIATLNDTVKTPHQQKFLANLIKELHQREKNGETNLIIKYIKGTPKIIKAQPKN